MTLRDELIQVAAVAVAIVTDLDAGSTRLVTDDHLGWTPAHRRVMADVTLERSEQEAKWGERRHVPIAEWLTILMEEVGEAAQAALDEVIYPVDADEDIIVTITDKGRASLKGEGR